MTLAPAISCWSSSAVFRSCEAASRRPLSEKEHEPINGFARPPKTLSYTLTFTVGANMSSSASATPSIRCVK